MVEGGTATRVTGFASFIVANKLKFIKENLNKWNRDVFGGIKAQKYKLMGIINSLDGKAESSGLAGDEIQQRKVFY